MELCPEVIQMELDLRLWEAITAKFGVKSWGYVTETTPQYYLSMKISYKTQGKQTWYYIDQEEHISQFLIDTNCMDMNPASVSTNARKKRAYV